MIFRSFLFGNNLHIFSHRAQQETSTSLCENLAEVRKFHLDRSYISPMRPYLPNLESLNRIFVEEISQAFIRCFYYFSIVSCGCF